MSDKQSKHLLLLRNGVFMSKQNINMGKYELFSGVYTGDIFEKVFKEELKEFEVGRFSFKGLRLSGLMLKSTVIANLCFGFFVIYHACTRHWLRKRYDYVITYDPFAAGLLGLLVSRLLRIRLICEVNGNYGERKTWMDGNKWLGALKFRYCRWMIPFVINRTFATKLLYAAQLHPFGSKIRADNIHVFHEFTPVLTQKFQSTPGDYVLFMGSPWDVKGVDVLIKAYRRISSQFPSFTLKIIGWFPEPGMSYLKQLAMDDPRIQISPAVHYDEAMRLMAASYAVVLPSRSEAMGRVLLEAMAYGKPVVASRVDGIPTYVKDGESGLLVETEKDEQLAQAIARLLSNPAFATELGLRSREYVRSCLSEESYLKCYRKMLRDPAHSLAGSE